MILHASMGTGPYFNLIHLVVRQGMRTSAYVTEEETRITDSDKDESNEDI